MRSAGQNHLGSPRVDHRLVAGGVVATLGVCLLVALFPFIPGLLGAPILAVIFSPLYRRLCRRLRPGAAAGLTITAAIALVLIFGLGLAFIVVREVPKVLAGSDLGAMLASLSMLQVHGVAVGSELATAGRSMAAWGSQQLFHIAGSTTRAVMNLVIAFFGLFYALVAGEQTWRSFCAYSPFSRATTERLRAKFRNVTKATLLGIGLGCVVQAIVIGTGFAVTGLSNPLFWGAVAGIVSVLPMLGASLVWLSGTVALVVEQRYAAAILLALIGTIISAHVESFIRPIVSRRVSKLHPLVTVIGAFAGIRYIGLPGVLLGPLALAYFFELLRAFELEFLGAPPRVAEEIG